LICTFPLGVPGEVEVTLKLNVTGWPGSDGCGVPWSTLVVVLALTTSNLSDVAER
jgi:hypothetical protein